MINFQVRRLEGIH